MKMDKEHLEELGFKFRETKGKLSKWSSRLIFDLAVAGVLAEPPVAGAVRHRPERM